MQSDVKNTITSFKLLLHIGNLGFESRSRLSSLAYRKTCDKSTLAREGEQLCLPTNTMCQIQPKVLNAKMTSTNESGEADLGILSSRPTALDKSIAPTIVSAPANPQHARSKEC